MTWILKLDFFKSCVYTVSTERDEVFFMDKLRAVDFVLEMILHFFRSGFTAFFFCGVK